MQLPTVTTERKAAIAKALEAKRKAHAEWLSLLPQISLADFDANQPDDSDEEYTEAFLDCDFSIGEDLVSISWTEPLENGTIAVWSWDEKCNEVLLGVYTADTPVYACGL